MTAWRLTGLHPRELERVTGGELEEYARQVIAASKRKGGRR